jgi:NTE family protein
MEDDLNKKIQIKLSRRLKQKAYNIFVLFIHQIQTFFSWCLNMHRSASRFKISIYCALVLVFLGPSALFAQFDGIPDSRSRIPKVGLVLSGGGARGAAHIGVLKVLEREKIPIDYIAGTSFGALVGAFYALGYSPSEIETIFMQQDWDKFFNNAPERSLTPFSERKNSGRQIQLSFHNGVPKLPSGLWEVQQLREILNELTTEPMLEAHYDFDQLPIPFRSVATDFITGKPEAFHEGSMTEALRASIAMPLFFTPVEKDGTLFVDGGLSNNLPTDVVRKMGADIVIAVDVSSPLYKADDIRDVIDVVNQAFGLQIQGNMKENEPKTDIILRPDLEGFVFVDFSRMPEISQRGEAEAEKYLEEIKNKTLEAGLPPRSHPPMSENKTLIIIESVDFDGLKNVSKRQMEREIRVRRGEPMDVTVLTGDMKRLYATQLFDSVDYYIEQITGDRYRLIYKVKEASMVNLDAGIRYDNDYEFVALAELTARQLFHSPTSLTFASQFGGLEEHSAKLLYTPSILPFLFVETKAFVSRRGRLDFLDQEHVDGYTEKRYGGQVMFGGIFWKQLEIAAGYSLENVRIDGGAAGRSRSEPESLGGFTLRFNRDSLDDREFPCRGMDLVLQADTKGRRFGGDFDYFKVRLELENYFSISEQSTLGINLMTGFVEYDAPFYDRFYVGGYSFSKKGSYPFLGYDRDEILSDQVAVLGIQYRHRIYNPSLGFVKSAYLTTFLNTGVDQFLDSKGLHGAGIGLALNTMLGPLRITGGFGNGGRTHFYLTFGPEF